MLNDDDMAKPRGNLPYDGLWDVITNFDYIGINPSQHLLVLIMAIVP